jgi:HSP20 family protein
MLGRTLRWFDPWREFWAVEDVFNTMASRFRPEAPGSEFPAINYYTEGNDAVVTAELPGVEPEKLDVSVVGKTLTISGERPHEGLEEGESYHRRELWHGRFKRTLELPFSVESGKVEARFERGVLTMVLPMAEDEKPRKITVSSN